MIQNQLNENPAHLFDQVPPAWAKALVAPKTQTAIKQLSLFLQQRLNEGAVIFPHTPLKALDRIEPQDVKVVILGQDPYHGPNQAQGLAFSVPQNCTCPPSLRNIFVELKREYPNELHHGGHDLNGWASQGVLLLNSVLTVEAATPQSHANKGWEIVTNALLQHVVNTPTPKVFMLWGASAQRKQEFLFKNIQTNNFEHAPRQGPIHILRANHPSPLSARRPPIPFIGCGHFRKANEWLSTQAVEPIQWLLN